MYCNFKKLHRGKTLKDKLWKIVRASNNSLYENALRELEEYDINAYTWVVNGPNKECWVKAFFPIYVKCDMLCNNLCESFNAYILEVRNLPVISMMEGIRELMMERIQKRRLWMRKRGEGPCTPKIREKLEEAMVASKDWKPIWNGLDTYQVKGPHGQ